MPCLSTYLSKPASSSLSVLGFCLHRLGIKKRKIENKELKKVTKKLGFRETFDLTKETPHEEEEAWDLSWKGSGCQLRFNGVRSRW